MQRYRRAGGRAQVSRSDAAEAFLEALTNAGQREGARFGNSGEAWAYVEEADAFVETLQRRPSARRVVLREQEPEVEALSVSTPYRRVREPEQPRTRRRRASTQATVTISPVGRRVAEAEDADEQTQTFSVALLDGVNLIATGRPLPVGRPAYTWRIADRSVARLVRRRGTTSQNHPNPVRVVGLAPGRTTLTVTYRSARNGTATASVNIVVRDVHRYGCHLLRRGDKDQDPANANRPKWGGQAGAAANRCRPAPANPPANPQHVRQLQEDLRAIGFLGVGAPNGIFDRSTEWAVREFQIYAKMKRVARIRAGAPRNQRQAAHLVAADLTVHGNQSAYVSSLEGTANTRRYRGAVSGVVNPQTRAALDHWVNHNWRCPVVVEAWRMNRGNRTQPASVNIWKHDDYTNAAARMFVRDFTGYYALPAGRNADDLRVVGDYASYLAWSGPRSVPPNHTWREAEVLPQALTGVANPAGATLSTYRAVRAVAEVECIGFFDSVNCYDNAFVSVGPCHWTLGITNNTHNVSAGELCGYLAYLRHADRAAFDTAVGSFGVRVAQNWVSNAGRADGSALFVTGSRKYAGRVALQRDNGTFAPLRTREAEWNYFKTWHWHYRFVMAGRSVNGYRRRMWDMARVRLRDLRSAPWGAGVAQVGAGPAARAATIGDVFTSERALAMILRWHIRSPGSVVAGGHAAGRLRNALARARAAGAALNWAGDPSTWTNAHETHLINGILAAAPANYRRSIEYVHDWPNWLGGRNPRGFALAAPIAARLNDDRNSLQFDGAGLPPAPP